MSTVIAITIQEGLDIAMDIADLEGEKNATTYFVIKKL